jgi:hypothetical protein
MATDGPTPPPCDHEIFQKGKSVAAIDGSSNAVERWVKKVAATAKARVDWHYSGGVANILHLGSKKSRERVIQVMHDLEPELQGTIMRFFEEGDSGLYRRGVTPVPKGTVAASYEGGRSSTFISGGSHKR